MADLVIRGLGIPKERSLWLCIKTDGTVYNIKPGGIGTAHTVGTAVHLPEGHGGLIDADSMLRKYVTDVHGLDGIYDTTDLPEMLSYMPSIVPAEGGTDNEHV